MWASFRTLRCSVIDNMSVAVALHGAAAVGIHDAWQLCEAAQPGSCAQAPCSMCYTCSIHRQGGQEPAPMMSSDMNIRYGADIPGQPGPCVRQAADDDHQAQPAVHASIKVQRMYGASRTSPSCCLQVEPGSQSQLLGSCGDGSFTIWDLRKLGPKMKALAAAQHSRACNSAYWSPQVCSHKDRVPKSVLTA